MAEDKRSPNRSDESSSVDPTFLRTGLFARTGDYWTMSYAGETITLKDIKGLTYIQRLLQRPGEEFHAADLLGGSTVGVDSEISSAEEHSLPTGVSIRGLGDAGAMLDAQAKQEYRRRLGELREELAELRERGDHERGEKVETEIDFIEREIVRAVGLGGRARRAGSVDERARLNVTRAIKSALQRIAAHHVALGELLQSSIKTGLFSVCVLRPAKAVSWRYSVESPERSSEREAPSCLLDRGQ